MHENGGVAPDNKTKNGIESTPKWVENELEYAKKFERMT